MHLTGKSELLQFQNKMFRPDVLPYTVVRYKKKHTENNILPTIDSETKKTFRITCLENFNQYLVNTTLHGLRYVGDRSVTVFERTFFVIMFIFVFASSIYFITNVWIKWSASPMIITLSAISTPITDFPFPAVTICNMNQAQRTAVQVIPADSVEYSLVQSLCVQTIDENVTDTNTKSGKWADFQKVLMKVSQPCDEMLVACRYAGEDQECMKIFSKILTDEGLCCIFNGVHSKYLMKGNFSKSQQLNNSDESTSNSNDWTPEKGYSAKDTNRMNSPRPAVGTGHKMGLTLMLDVSEREYYCSSTDSIGFKILLHSPNELPKISNYGTAISNGFETRVVIDPTLSEASYSIQSIPLNVRQCKFESENTLKFYRTYSRRNCQTECEAKLYLDHCNCSLYYMPRFNDDINICGRKDTECVNLVARLLRAKDNASFQCECLPGCFAVSYATEISLSPLLSGSTWLTEKRMRTSNTAIVHIYYKENSFRSQRKQELIGFTEFLSNTGGLLGLFMGFSVISISELLYFMSIRPYCNYLRISKRRGRRFGRMLQKVRDLRTKTKSQITSQALTTRNVDNIVFPYVN